MNWKGLQLRQS